jgi:hypothetical protein
VYSRGSPFTFIVELLLHLPSHEINDSQINDCPLKEILRSRDK